MPIHKDSCGFEVATYLGEELLFNLSFVQHISKAGVISDGHFTGSLTRGNLFPKVIKSMGMCLFCGDIDWRHFQEHHPDPVKMEDFTITLCANCHAELHWAAGTNFWVRPHKKAKEEEGQ